MREVQQLIETVHQMYDEDGVATERITHAVTFLHLHQEEEDEARFWYRIMRYIDLMKGSASDG